MNPIIGIVLAVFCGVLIVVSLATENWTALGAAIIGFIFAFFSIVLFIVRKELQ